ncbi:MAG TPA: GtrA family protein [Patescibacteria group bacterium]|nr:GtrA family protein [Patescibacteria group bacterium]
MDSTKQLARKLYKHSLVRYVITGGTTFAIDFLVLVLLHGALKVNVLIAASISYWVSIAFNFSINRIWTFEATETRLIKHVAPYLVLLCFNYGFTIAFIGVTTHLGMLYTVSKVLAVAIQTFWTYFAYKKIIFR